MINKVIFSILVIAVASISFTALLTNQDKEMNVQEEITIQKMSSYIATDVDEIKALSTVILEGRVIDKYVVMESRDEFGKFVDNDSSLAAVTYPNIIYEVKTMVNYKGAEQDSILLQIPGGTMNGITVTSDHVEYAVGDIVVVLVDGPFENGYYQPTSGPHSIFKIDGDLASTVRGSLNADQLKDSLD